MMLGGCRRTLGCRFAENKFSLSLISYKHSPIMISPPHFLDDFQDSLIICDNSSNIISEQLPCSPESFSSSLAALLELLEHALTLLEGRQVPAALRSLQELAQKINSKRSFISTLKNPKMEALFSRIEFIGLYHMSYAYSYLDKQTELLENNQKVVSLIHKLQKIEDISQTLKVNSKRLILSNGEQTLPNRSEPVFLTKSTNGSMSMSVKMTTQKYPFFENSNRMKFNIIFARFLLFSCFRLSQKQHHNLAYSQALKAQEIIVDMIKNLDTEEGTKKEPGARLANDKIQFQKILKRQAYPIVKQIKQDIEIDDTSKSQSLSLVKSTIASWKRNPQHSKKDLRQHYANCYTSASLNSPKQERSLLGVRSMKSTVIRNPSRNSSKKKPQCIKDIVDLQQLKMDDLHQCNNTLSELTAQKIRQKLQLLCASYFCLAIELWNIVQEGQDVSESASGLDSGRKYYRDQHGKSFIKQSKFKDSELCLLKAIGIIVSYLKSHEGLLDNLVEVYQRKFEGSMMVIMEENSKQISLSMSRGKDCQSRLSCRLLENQRGRQMKSGKSSFINLQRDTNYPEEIIKPVIRPDDNYYKMGKEDNTLQSGNKLKAHHKKKSPASFMKKKSSQDKSRSLKHHNKSNSLNRSSLSKRKTPHPSTNSSGSNQKKGSLMRSLRKRISPHELTTKHSGRTH